jgi:hypothetical protein
MPFSISSGPRCSSGFGVRPIPECGLPPPTDSSGPERPLGSSLGRSALSRSESVPACLVALSSVENHPISVPARCGGRGSSPADPSAVVGAAVRGDDSPDPPEPAELVPGRSSTAAVSPARTAPEAWPGGPAVPGSPWPRSAAGPCAGGPDIPWPPSPRSTWEAACPEGVTCESTRPCVAIPCRSERCSGRWSSGSAIPASPLAPVRSPPSATGSCSTCWSAAAAIDPCRSKGPSVTASSGGRAAALPGGPPGRPSAGASAAPTESLPRGVGAVCPTVASDSPVTEEAPVEGTVDEGLSVSGDGGAIALGEDEGELRPSAAGS